MMGTICTWVMRCRSTSARKGSGAKRGSSTTSPPVSMAVMANPLGAEW